MLTKALRCCTLALTLFSLPVLAANDLHGKTFKDWIGQCEAAPDGRELCYLLQRLETKDTEETLLVTQVGRHLETNDTLVIFHLPKTFDEDEQLLFKVDKNAAIAIGFHCDEKHCQGGFKLDHQMMSELKRGNRAVISFMNVFDGKREILPISLMGFTAGLNALK